MIVNEDLFVIQRFSPLDYKDSSVDFVIEYSYQNTVFGDVFVASTEVGICCLLLVDGFNTELAELKKNFPYAKYVNIANNLHVRTISLFLPKKSNINDVIKLHVKGTDFQIDTWKALLKIGFGYTLTYKEVAFIAGYKNAYRAVGTAVKNNLISILIPCHRVVKSDGKCGNYRWGMHKKQKILELEKDL